MPQLMTDRYWPVKYNFTFNSNRTIFKFSHWNSSWNRRKPVLYFVNGKFFKWTITGHEIFFFLKMRKILSPIPGFQMILKRFRAYLWNTKHVEVHSWRQCTHLKTFQDIFWIFCREVEGHIYRSWPINGYISDEVDFGIRTAWNLRSDHT